MAGLHQTSLDAKGRGVCLMKRNPELLGAAGGWGVGGISKGKVVRDSTGALNYSKADHEGSCNRIRVNILTLSQSH